MDQQRHQDYQHRAGRVPDAQWQKRLNRLGSLERTLYHVTDWDAAQKIMQSGKILRGKTGLGGGGIYFATAVDKASRKANSKGVLITCRVRLGNIKTIAINGDESITFTALLNEGYDSVLIPRQAGEEYVVYNSDQVHILEIKEMASDKILFTDVFSGQREPRYPPRPQSAGNYAGNAADSGSGAESKQYQPYRERSSCDQSPQWPARMQRIGASERVLFNITNEQTAKKIAHSHTLLREDGGIAGPGIYLYASTELAHRAMTGSITVLVTCNVKLGNVKNLAPRGDKSITFTSLFNEGFDSVCVADPQGDLFVVYNNDQVRVTKVQNTRNNEVFYSSSYDDGSTLRSSLNRGHNPYPRSRTAHGFAEVRQHRALGEEYQPRPFSGGLPQTSRSPKTRRIPAKMANEVDVDRSGSSYVEPTGEIPFNTGFFAAKARRTPPQSDTVEDFDARRSNVEPKAQSIPSQRNTVDETSGIGSSDAAGTPQDFSFYDAGVAASADPVRRDSFGSIETATEALKVERRNRCSIM